MAQLVLNLLPQACGSGYYSYSSSDRQYGTAATIAAILDVCGSVQFNMPGLLVGVGDMSLRHGGHMAPHQSHQHGTNVDVRPFRKDRMGAPVTILDTSYDGEATRLLALSFLAHRNVRRILFNDTKIPGVHAFPGHHNHLHIEMRT